MRQGRFDPPFSFESDDGIDRDSIFDATPSRKRGFKRPRKPWSLVKEWNLDEYDREVTYEEIKTIMAQSLDEAGEKSFIKPNSNAIAGWRAKQVSYFFLILFLYLTNSSFHCRTTCLAKPSLRQTILSFVHLWNDAGALSNFEFLRPHTASSSILRVSILLRVMSKTRCQSF
jgi:hypothetical protein